MFLFFAFIGAFAGYIYVMLLMPLLLNQDRDNIGTWPQRFFAVILPSALSAIFIVEDFFAIDVGYREFISGLHPAVQYIEIYIFLYALVVASLFYIYPFLAFVNQLLEKHIFQSDTKIIRLISIYYRKLPKNKIVATVAFSWGVLIILASIVDMMFELSDGKGVTGFGGAVICYYAIKYSEKQRGKPELTLISVLYSIGGLLMIFLGIAESYSKGETLWLLLVALGIIHLLLGRWAYENVHDQIVK
jgi:hypothetical protein